MCADLCPVLFACRSIRSTLDMMSAAEKLVQMGAKAVLLKGGHMASELAAKGQVPEQVSAALGCLEGCLVVLSEASLVYAGSAQLRLCPCK